MLFCYQAELYQMQRRACRRSEEALRHKQLGSQIDSATTLGNARLWAVKAAGFVVTVMNLIANAELSIPPSPRTASQKSGSLRNNLVEPRLIALPIREGQDIPSLTRCQQSRLFKDSV
jgi:hypothetical protein